MAHIFFGVMGWGFNPCHNAREARRRLWGNIENYLWDCGGALKKASKTDTVKFMHEPMGAVLLLFVLFFFVLFFSTSLFFIDFLLG